MILTVLMFVLYILAYAVAGIWLGAAIVVLVILFLSAFGILMP